MAHAGYDFVLCEVIAPRASTISGSSLRQINLTGKSPKPVQSLAQKYSAFHCTQISGYFPAVPSRQEGRIARRHERGTGCGGRGSVRREACSQRGYP